MIDLFVILSGLVIFSAAEELEPSEKPLEKNPTVFLIDDALVRTAAIAVILGCIVVAILVTVCCFCSKCPMYNIFRRNLEAHDIAAFGTREEEPLTNGVPLTAINGQSIRIKPVAELKPLHFFPNRIYRRSTSTPRTGGA